jgi:hypothetical protein
VQVAHDLLEGAVAEVGGDLAHGGPALEHVGREAVAQRTDTLLINLDWRGLPTGSTRSLARRFTWCGG